jgi:hypothetical protein
MERIRVDLADDEYKGLVLLSQQELRPVLEEARHVIRETLRARGLLEDGPPSVPTAGGKAA